MATSVSTIPAIVLTGQGALNAGIGIWGVLRPLDIAAQLSTSFGEAISIPVAYTVSLQLLNMGVFTIFAASRPSLHRRALIARAVIHSFTGYLFWSLGGGVRNASWLEFGSAAVHALAIPFVGVQFA